MQMKWFWNIITKADRPEYMEWQAQFLKWMKHMYIWIESNVYIIWIYELYSKIFI